MSCTVHNNSLCFCATGTRILNKQFEEYVEYSLSAVPGGVEQVRPSAIHKLHM